MFSLFKPSSSQPSANQIAQMDVKALVDSAISENNVTVFSKSWCPYCVRAKKLLASSYPNVNVKVLEIDDMAEEDQIQTYLEQKTRQRTVPSVFINQKHVGGYDDLSALQRKGELAQLLSP